MNIPSFLAPSDAFAPRHLGPGPEDHVAMLAQIGAKSLDDLIGETVPAGIRMSAALDLPAARGEHEALADLAAMIDENQVHRSYIGMGYSGTITRSAVPSGLQGYGSPAVDGVRGSRVDGGSLARYWPSRQRFG